jgi:single-strand DNA-binding protein
LAGSLNKVQIIGHLGKDPEVRNTQTGGKIVNLTVATSESWKDKASGEKKERTEWHRVVIFAEHAANFAEKYLHKGDMVYVEGALQTRKWTDQAGVEKYSTEIVVSQFKGELTSLGSKGDGGGSSAPAQTQQRMGRVDVSAAADIDDSIPF